MRQGWKMLGGRPPLKKQKWGGGVASYKQATTNVVWEKRLDGD